MATHKSRYAAKKKMGVKINHDRHPKRGVRWCELCQKDKRRNCR